MANVIIEWSDKAIRDIGQIKRFYVKNSDLPNAIQKLERIIEDIEKLADNPLLGRANPDLLGSEYWYALETTYKVFYERTGPNSIKVFRVWPSRSKVLKPDQIK